MVIDLKKYFLSDDLSDTVEYDLDLSQVEVNGVKPFLEPVKVRAVFHSCGLGSTFALHSDDAL